MTTVYILKRNDKPVYATSIFSFFENKKEEFKAAGIPLEIKFSEMNDVEHFKLLDMCAKNIIALKSLEMVDKS